MSAPLFFGYGSLVNSGTHSYPNLRNASLKGYRRVWRHTSLRPVAFLSVEADADSTIDGIVAEVPNGDWTALDAREAAYTRHDVTAITKHMGAPAPVAVYAVPQENIGSAQTAHPILLSYIDVVVQGYLRLYGEIGAQAFFNSTTGWDAPIQNDRSDPLYPRAQSLTKTETAFVDHALARVL